MGAQMAGHLGAGRGRTIPTMTGTSETGPVRIRKRGPTVLAELRLYWTRDLQRDKLEVCLRIGCHEQADTGAMSLQV